MLIQSSCNVAYWAWEWHCLSLIILHFGMKCQLSHIIQKTLDKQKSEGMQYCITFEELAKRGHDCQWSQCIELDETPESRLEKEAGGTLWSMASMVAGIGLVGRPQWQVHKDTQ